MRLLGAGQDSEAIVLSRRLNLDGMDTYTFATSRQIKFPVHVKM
jgi:hypothetical protein